MYPLDHSLIQSPPSSSTVCFEGYPPQFMLLGASLKWEEELAHIRADQGVFLFEDGSDKFECFVVRQKDLQIYQVNSFAELHKKIWRAGRENFTILSEVGRYAVIYHP